MTYICYRFRAGLCPASIIDLSTFDKLTHACIHNHKHTHTHTHFKPTFNKMSGHCFKFNARKCLVVLACYISACLRGVVNTTLPFIYEELLEKFGKSASVTAGTISLFIGLKCFLGESFP